MSLRSLVGALVGTGGERIRECRQCGTTVDEGQAVCPACGAENVAEYDLG